MDLLGYPILILLILTALAIVCFYVGGVVAICIKSFKYHPKGTRNNLLKYLGSLLLTPLFMFLGLLSFMVITRFNNKSGKAIEASPLQDFTDEVVVIYVHGTFEPDAVWTRPSHPLSAAIEEKFGPGIRIERFVWSGANLISERQSAAEKLAKMITHYQSGNCCVHLIAHSHGGAVLTEALSHLSIAPNSTVFMATPFISLEQVNLPAMTRQSLNFGFLTATAFSIALILKLFQFASWGQCLQLFGALFATLIIIEVFISRKRNEPSALDDHRPLLSTTPPNPHTTRIYISNGDEAGAALQFASLMGSTLRNLISSLFSAADQLDQTASAGRNESQQTKFNITYLPVCAFFIALIGLVAERLIFAGKWSGIFLLLYAAIAMVCAGILVAYKIKRGAVSEFISSFFLFHSSMAAVANALTKAAFGFNSKDARRQHGIFATSSETPVGKWQVYKSQSQSSAALQHSWIYQNEETQRDIANFIWSRTPSDRTGSLIYATGIHEFGR